MSVLQLRDVGHVYDAGSPWEHRALRGVSFTVVGGEAVPVHGPNGAGKSTLFRVLTGLVGPSEGAATLDGVPLTAARERIGGCLQAARLQLFGVTVGEDLRLDHRVDTARAAEALARVGLDPAAYFSRRVDELSGGEQRLVALAGALLRAPGLLVLDEPFAGVDAGRTESLLTALAAATAAGIAVVVLTPDPDEARRVGPRVLELAPC